MEILLSNRFKSFYWRTGMMILAVIIAQVAEFIPTLGDMINPAVITVLGLILGEISKALNTKAK